MSRSGKISFVVVLAVFFVSGAAALLYQITWLKYLGLVFGNTVEAAATLIAIFLAGLGIGAWLFGRRPRSLHPLIVYALLEALTGLFGSFSPNGFSLLDSLYVHAFRSFGGSSAEIALVRGLGAALFLLPPTILMGGTLPVLVRWWKGSERGTGRAVSALYAVNTLGATAGVAASGFYFIPQFGLLNTIFVAVAANFGLAAVGAMLAWRYRGGGTGMPSEPAALVMPARHRDADSRCELPDGVHVHCGRGVLDPDSGVAPGQQRVCLQRHALFVSHRYRRGQRTDPTVPRQDPPFACSGLAGARAGCLSRSADSLFHRVFRCSRGSGHDPSASDLLGNAGGPDHGGIQCGVHPDSHHGSNLSVDRQTVRGRLPGERNASGGKHLFREHHRKYCRFVDRRFSAHSVARITARAVRHGGDQSDHRDRVPARRPRCGLCPRWVAPAGAGLPR